MASDKSNLILLPNYNPILMKPYTLVFFNLLIVWSRCVSLIDLFGLRYLYQDLGVISTTVVTDGQNTTTYQASPQTYSFLKQFETLTDFCVYKCPKFYHLPCFVVFNCNIQIRNFVLIFFLPLFIIIVTALFCSRGWWTPKCWWYYFKLFAGVSLGIWVYNRIKGNKGQEDDNRRTESGDDGGDKNMQHSTGSDDEI